MLPALEVDLEKGEEDVGFLIYASLLGGISWWHLFLMASIGGIYYWWHPLLVLDCGECGFRGCEKEKLVIG